MFIRKAKLAKLIKQIEAHGYTMGYTVGTRKGFDAGYKKGFNEGVNYDREKTQVRAKD